MCLRNVQTHDNVTVSRFMLHCRLCAAFCVPVVQTQPCQPTSPASSRGICIIRGAVTAAVRSFSQARSRLGECQNDACCRCGCCVVCAFAYVLPSELMKTYGMAQIKSTATSKEWLVAIHLACSAAARLPEISLVRCSRECT